MKIVYSVPALVPCGGITHPLFVIQKLVAKGHEVMIYSPCIDDLEALPEVPESVQIVKHPRVHSNLYSLPSEAKLLRFTRTFLDLTLGLRRISRDLPSDADIVVAGFFPNAIAASRMRRRTKSRCRIIQQLHADPDYFLPHCYRRRYYRIWAGSPRLADHLLTVNEALGEKLRGKYGKPVTVVGNGVDDIFFEKTRLDRQRLESVLHTAGRPYIVYVGSLGYRKGTDTLLESFAVLAERRKDLFLVMVGLGFWKEYYEKMASRLGVLDRVRYVPGPGLVVALLVICFSYMHPVAYVADPVVDIDIVDEVRVPLYGLGVPYLPLRRLRTVGRYDDQAADYIEGIGCAVDLGVVDVEYPYPRVADLRYDLECRRRAVGR